MTIKQKEYCWVMINVIIWQIAIALLIALIFNPH